MIGPYELAMIVGILATMVLFTVLPFWMIFVKAGYPGWYSLATLIPVLNIVAIFFLALADWPSQRSINKEA